MKRALFHDIAESITGDVITPTKRIVPNFRDILIEAEERMLEKHFFPLIPDIARKDFVQYLTDETSPEAKLAKYADDLCMILEALIEIHAGNEIFKKPYDTLKAKCNRIESASVEYFLKHVPDRFSDNIDSVFALNL